MSAVLKISQPDFKQNFDQRFFKEAEDLFLHKRAGHLIHRCYSGAGYNYWNKFMQAPDYYVTRSEQRIIQESSTLINDLDAIRKNNITVVELGPGTGEAIKTKTLPFLKAIDSKVSYSPIDLSQEALRECKSVCDNFPGVEFLPVLGDFNKVPFSSHEWSKRLVVEFGVTLSNIPGLPKDPIPVRQLALYLAHYRSKLQKGDIYAVTYDANQDEETLTRAYADKYCEKWAIALLQRMKDELPISSDFDPNNFRFKSLWYPDKFLLGHTMIAKSSGQFYLGDQLIKYEAGEKFGITNSYKYPVDFFTKVAAAAQFRTLDIFDDGEGRLVLHLLQAV